MQTDQILDLFNLGETADSTDEKSKGAPGASGADEMDMVDVDGEVKDKGRGLLDGLGELWDERQYEEEYDLGSFLASIKG
jgi:TATA-binding protein-associated factor